jgi:uncharacterized membrane protein YgaE (UPF0421/DUF939 family)
VTAAPASSVSSVHVGPGAIRTLKQALKAAAAGVLSVLAARWLKLPQAYWAAISSLIVMQSNVGGTVRASWKRLAGTVIGAVVGTVVVLLWGANLAGFGLAVAATIILCALPRLNESFRLATVTVAIVMLTGAHEAGWIVALHRFLEVMLGIVVAIFVTAVIWPARSREALRAVLAEAIATMQQLFVEIMARYRGAATAPVETHKADAAAKLRNAQDLLREVTYEPGSQRSGADALRALTLQAERIYSALDGLELAATDSLSERYSDRFKPELDALTSALSEAFGCLTATIRTGSCGRWPDLLAAGSLLEAKVAELRQRGTPATYDLEEVLRFYSLVLGLRNLARELVLARLPELDINSA